MGASGRVEVETIVAENSVEETMQEYERKSSSQSETGYVPSSRTFSRDYLATKTQALLRSLDYITDFQSFRKPSLEGTKHESDPSMRLREINAKWKDQLTHQLLKSEKMDSTHAKTPKVTFGLS